MARSLLIGQPQRGCTAEAEDGVDHTIHRAVANEALFYELSALSPWTIQTEYSKTNSSLNFVKIGVIVVSVQGKSLKSLDVLLGLGRTALSAERQQHVFRSTSPTHN